MERDQGLFVVNQLGRLNSLKECKDLLADTKAKPQDCRGWIEQVLLLENRPDVLEAFEKWDPPKFPIG